MTISGGISSASSAAATNNKKAIFAREAALNGAVVSRRFVIPQADTVESLSFNCVSADPTVRVMAKVESENAAGAFTLLPGGYIPLRPGESENFAFIGGLLAGQRRNIGRISFQAYYDNGIAGIRPTAAAFGVIGTLGEVAAEDFGLYTVAPTATVTGGGYSTAPTLTVALDAMGSLVFTIATVGVGGDGTNAAIVLAGGTATRAASGLVGLPGMAAAAVTTQVDVEVNGIGA